jgi:3-hydroxyisobutyrate dehydrogenase
MPGIVAVLGTGIMGSGMARSLLREGLTVHAWNRTRAKADPLAEDGATVFDSAADAVRDAEVIITILNDGPAVASTLEAAAPGVRAGQVLLQCSTVGPEATEELAGRAAALGLVFLDAPVLGTRQPAENGQLTVFVAGPGSARAVVEPVLSAIGQKTQWLSETPGAASRLKLVVNSWVLTLTNAIGETVALAEALEVDPKAFLDAVAGVPLDVGYLHVKAAALLSGDLTPSFAVSTALKDARLILEAADPARLDLVAASAARFERTEELGRGDDDMIASYYASQAPR